MRDIYIVVALSISVFLFLFILFKDWKNPFNKISKKIKSVGDFAKIEKSLEEKIFKVDITNRKRSQINYITGEKISLGDRLRNRLNSVILNKNHSWGYLTFILMTFLGMWIGLSIGKLLNNFGISIVLGVVGSTLPYMYLTFRIKEVERDKDKKLLMVMGNIVATYMLKDSFPLSVKEVLPTIPNPLYPHFKLFIDDIMYFGSDGLVDAADRLAKSINNYFFYEFMQLAVQSEYGESGLKYTMKSIPIDYQRYLEKNEKYSRIISDFNIEFILRILLFPLVIGFIRIVSDDYYKILTENIIGKIILFGVMLLYVVATIIFRKYNKDIKLEL